MRQGPGLAYGVGDGRLGAVAAMGEKGLGLGEEFFFGGPEMGHMGDVEQQAFRFVAIFEGDAWAEALACFGQLYQCAAVDGGLVGRNGQVADERLGFGEGLAKRDALSGGGARAGGNDPASRAVGNERERAAFKLGPGALEALDRPVR